MVRNFIVSITRSRISLSGTALSLAALVLMLSLFALEQFGFEGGPYLGILTFLILPMIFVVGLILIPIGAILWRRKVSRLSGGESMPLMPVFDLNQSFEIFPCFFNSLKKQEPGKGTNLFTET